MTLTTNGDGVADPQVEPLPCPLCDGDLEGGICPSTDGFVRCPYCDEDARRLVEGRMATTNKHWVDVVCPHFIGMLGLEKEVEDQRGWLPIDPGSSPATLVLPSDIDEIDPEALSELLLARAQDLGLTSDPCAVLDQYTWDVAVVTEAIARAPAGMDIAMIEDWCGTGVVWAREPAEAVAALEAHAERCAQVLLEAPRDG